MPQQESQEMTIENLEKMPASMHDLLIRVDERLKRMERDLATFKDHYVRREEFSPVRNIVFGMISVIMITVLAALITLVVKK